MHEKEIKGIETELSCQTEFIKRGINVSVPVSAYCKYDFIADIDGNLKKIQVKTARKRTTGFMISTLSTHLTSNGPRKNTYTEKEIDYFCTIYENQCYLIPAKEVIGKTQFTLTLFPDKRVNNYLIMHAKNYTLDYQIELLKTGTEQINTKFIINKCLKDGTIVNSYKTERECALSCGDISKQAHIHECINGSRKSAYGFLWRKDIEPL